MKTYDPFARYYDADFRDQIDDLSLYRELGRRNDGPLLELMCGSGRVLVPLAEEGYTITGVDSSAAMLEIARQRLLEVGASEQVTLIEGDVRSVELPAQHFGMAFVAINSFMHLEEVRDQLATLAVAKRALQKRGLLVLDLFNPDPNQMLREDNHLSLDREYQLGDRWVQKFVAIDTDVASQTSAVTYLYDETDREGRLARRTMHFTMRWFYRFELEHLLARAGFSMRGLYGSYELDSYTSLSPRLIAVATPGK